MPARHIGGPTHPAKLATTHEGIEYGYTSTRATAMTASTRRYDLDWVRILAFALLILYHTGMYYVSWDWHVKSPFASSTLEPLMMLSSPWRLSLLFLVSGAATSFLFAKSSEGFLGSRSKRLLIPLIFGMLVIVPPQSYYEVVEKAGYADGYLAFWVRYLAGDDTFCRDGDCLDIPTWNHLWFVAYLWVYTVLLWVALRFAPRWVARIESSMPRLLNGAALLIVPIALLALVRMLMVARFPSTHGLFDDWYNHAQYFSVFLFGFLAARSDSIWEQLRAQRWIALGLAMLSYAFIAWYFNFSPYTDESPPPELLRNLQRLIYSANSWASIAAILGFARQANPGDSAARRYFTEAIFPFYIVHQTAIVVFSQALKPLALRPALEGPLLIMMTFAACFVSFEIVRRIRWLRPLFGLRL
jgi:glucan biosynthesis protein C